jgi:hypothetical protein
VLHERVRWRGGRPDGVVEAAIDGGRLRRPDRGDVRAGARHVHANGARLSEDEREGGDGGRHGPPTLYNRA